MRVPPLLSAVLAVACLGGAGYLAVVEDNPAQDSVWTAPSEPAPSSTPLFTAPSASPTPLASPSPPPPPPADRGQVTADLMAILDDPEHDSGGGLSVVVLDEYGREVVARGPDLPLLPASTMKLLTAAAALDLHGADGRLRTPVLVNGTVTARGTLQGDVIVLAGGDPSLASLEYRSFVFPARPASHTEDLVTILREAGIQRVTGDVVVDPGAYADQRIPTGWRDAYLAELDARHITGLTVDAGLTVQVNHPRSSWSTLTNEDLRDDGVVVRLAADPVQRTAVVLHEELLRARLPIEGEPIVGVASTDAREIGAIESPPMVELLRFMVKESDNHIADTLLREIGATVTGRSTWASSAEAVEVLLAELDISLGTSVIADGSGLSRDDRLSARLLAEVDQQLTVSHGDAWADLQSIAGEDGTLRRRLDGTIADGRFRGKTGTLNDVRALVGAVEGPDGSRYHVAIVGNGGEVWRVNTLTDEIILRLTRSLWCGVANAPTDVVLACAA